MSHPNSTPRGQAIGHIAIMSGSSRSAHEMIPAPWAARHASWAASSPRSRCEIRRATGSSGGSGADRQHPGLCNPATATRASSIGHHVGQVFYPGFPLRFLLALLPLLDHRVSVAGGWVQLGAGHARGALARHPRPHPGRGRVLHVVHLVRGRRLPGPRCPRWRALVWSGSPD